MQLAAKLANCPIGGELTSNYSDGWWIDRLEIRLGRYRVTLRQRPELFGYPLPSIKGTCVYTTDVTIHNLPHDGLQRGKRIVEDLSWLLSFATMSQVRPFEYTWGNRRSGTAVQGVTLSYSPTLEIRDGLIVRRYLELCWARYRKLRSARKLTAVIHYVVDAEAPGLFEEGRLLYIFVALENLKATYARSKGYPFSKGMFRLRGAILGFETILQEMLREVGMRKGIRRAVILRNEIVHQGFSRRPFDSLITSYEFCQDLVREYLLRLLGYRGPYETYRGHAAKRL